MMPCAKNRFIEFIIMYKVVSCINYVYVQTLKINSEKFNMYVVGSYIKNVYDVIYLHVVCSYTKYMMSYIFTHTKNLVLKPYLHAH